ncbi:MAG: DUF952 domain-containing protein [Vulcanimicrobiota bacterium]
MKAIYHFVENEYFRHFKDKTQYFSPDFFNEGFIHCTGEPNVVISICNNINRNSPHDFVLLKIDENKVKAPVIYEKNPGSHIEFPHIYGFINKDAIVDIKTMQRTSSGDFLFPF